ncbi:KEOPS complex kinase/ATPase Bud32 [Nitrososphaera viennensis]|uniref:non-specific serine/threonine protein kinase n=1 Tax=Nitrososphaera viennensis TaxID=1034015 RepID=A0A977IG78_9ARCH|nr:KEOPS complex kinase/ATPase Bud32 [Nitrososphaera viennensis]UVS70471.1 KEOPS complex kinase/ATPase Bud32 [Nitrososphaera viennensis]
MQQLLKKGAEADIYLTGWRGRPAVAKVREPKPYRHSALDLSIRRQRTVHEAGFMSAAKSAGVRAPLVYFVDPERAEIIMERVEGTPARDALTVKLCREMGRCAALLHAAGIVHGDLTTSNFISAGDGDRLVLLDFGLSYYSERTEDMAVDVRLIKEVFTSAHISVRGAFSSFVKGYESVAGKKRTAKILENVREIEQRGRYARVA